VTKSVTTGLFSGLTKHVFRCLMRVLTKPLTRCLTKSLTPYLSRILSGCLSDCLFSNLAAVTLPLNCKLETGNWSLAPRARSCPLPSDLARTFLLQHLCRTTSPPPQHEFAIVATLTRDCAELDSCRCSVITVTR
jgi:hypothetical protein